MAAMCQSVEVGEREAQAIATEASVCGGPRKRGPDHGYQASVCGGPRKRDPGQGYQAY